VRNQGVGSWPVRRARKTPERVAIEYEDRSWTYRELSERVLCLAHALRRLGVERGDRVVYLGPNHPSLLETFFAAGQLGAVFVPLNTRLAGPELAWQAADSGARLLVHAPSPVAAEIPVATRVEVGAGYEDLLSRGDAGDRAEAIDEPVAADDPCIVMYTSGTTGRPKGAVLSHGNITWNSVNVLVDADLAGDEVTLVVAPLFHTAALNMICLPTLLKGGRVVLAAAFDAGRVLEIIERRGVTLMFAVPAMYNVMAGHPAWPDTDLSSLRTLMCGGAPVPDGTINTYLARGLTFVQGYGMTEASPGVLLLDRSQVLAKAGSAGVPHFFTDVRVVRPDQTEATPGDKGEIVVSGPNVMLGYWGRPEETAAALGDPGTTGERWFRSGDVAVTDEDGYVFVVDRVKDMIISGGENIYPAEVENVLSEHPAVLECAVIGVPDEKWGEVGRAVLVLRPGATADEEELRSFLLGRIAKYKIPRSFRFADGLPRNAVGKLLKNRLRDTYSEGTT
jgi:fatty-acyl-CoA synthase